jgi:hypothetical protein
VDGCEIIARELVVSCGDAAEVLETADGAFDAIAVPVEAAVEVVPALAGRVVGMTGRVP